MQRTLKREWKVLENVEREGKAVMIKKISSFVSIQVSKNFFGASFGNFL